MTSGRVSHRALLAALVSGLVGLVALAAVTVVVARYGPESSVALTEEGPYRGSEPQSRIVLPDFELPSYRGRRVASHDLRGRIVLLTLLDSQCTDSCPIIASVVARSIDRLSAAARKEVRAVAISADPTEDTPASVTRFLRARRAEGRLDYLIGSERELRPLWNALHVLPSHDTRRDTVHSAPVRIYDHGGVWISTLHPGADLTERNLLHDIRYALRARDAKGETR